LLRRTLLKKLFNVNFLVRGAFQRKLPSCVTATTMNSRSAFLNGEAATGNFKLVDALALQSFADGGPTDGIN